MKELVKKRNFKKKQLILLVSFISLIIIVAGYFYYKSEESSIKEDKYHSLKAIADLKINQINSWIEERKGDALLLARSPLARSALKNFLREPDNKDFRDELKNRLLVTLELFHFDGITLIDRKKKVLLTTVNQEDHLSEYIKIKIDEAFLSKNTFFSDFYKCSVHKKIHYDIIQPILDEQGNVIVAYILRIDPEKYLYPLIQSWPTPSKSSETLIIRKDGDSALFLNSLRFHPNAALNLKVPLNDINIPAAKAVAGHHGIFEGKDYRGKAVLADIRDVHNTPWFIVSKVDQEEIYSDLKAKTFIILLLTLFLIIATGATITFFYVNRQRILLGELLNKEKNLNAIQETYKITLYSIGDGVITTDTNGKIKQMNTVAENLTGWKEFEAIDRYISEVFKVINEEDRNEVPNPVSRVMEEGTVIGLANHTLLISKYGKEIPIADSGAPIKDVKGNITGVVLVFRDQTEERMAQKLIEIRLNLFEYSHNHTVAELLTKTLDEVEKLTESSIGFYHFVEADQETLCLQAWSTKTSTEFCNASGSGLHYKISEAGVWVDCVHQRKPIIHNDYASLTYKKGMPEGHAKVVRELVVPIFRKEKIVAIMGVGNKLNEYTDKDLSIATYFADVVWIIIEQKRQQEKIIIEKEKLNQYLDLIESLIVLIDKNQNIELLNRKGYQILGYEPGTLIGKNWFDYCLPEVVREGVKTVFNRILKGEIESLEYFENEILTKSKEIRLIGWHNTIIKDENGNAIGTLSAGEDITDRKKAEEALRIAEEKYRTLVDNSLSIIYTLNIDGNLTYVSPSWEKLLGHKYDEIVGHNYKDFVFEDDIPIYEEFFKKTLEKDIPNTDVQYRVFHKDGSIRWHRSVISYSYDYNKGETLLVGNAIDISDYKHFESILVQKEHETSLMLNSMLNAFVLFESVFDENNIFISYRFIHINKAYEEITNVKLEDVKGKTVHEVWPQTEPEWIKRYGEVAVTGISREFELYHEPTHKLYHCQVYRPFTTQDKFCVIFEDVTERKQNEEKLRHVFESSNVGKSITYLDGEIHVNQAFSKMLGYSQEELQSKKWQDITYPDDIEPNTKLLETMLNGEKDSNRFIKRYIHKDGSIIWADVSVTLIRKINSNLKYFITTVIDITERVKIENENNINQSRIKAQLELSSMTDSEIKEITDFTLEEAIKLTSSEFGYLAFLNEDETILSMYSWSKEAMKQCAIEDKLLVYKVEETGLWGESIRQRKPIITNDYETPNPYKKGYPEGHVKVLKHLNVPIFDGHRIVALVGVGNKKDDYNEKDINQITLLSQGMWSIIKSQRVENELRKSEEKFRKAFLTSPDSVTITRLTDGMFVSVNYGFTQITGYTPAEVIGKTSFEINIWKDPEDRKAVVNGVLENGEVHNYGAVFRTKDGEIYGLMSATIIELDGVPHILNITRDISDLKRAEEALKESEEKYKTLIEMSQDAMLINQNNIITYINPAALKLFGANEFNQIIGKSPFEFFHPDFHNSIKQRIEYLLVERLPLSLVEEKVVRLDGEVIDVEVAASPIEIKGQKAIQVVLRDISERKKAEKELKERERIYYNLISNLPGFVYRCANDKDWTMSYISTQCKDITGYSPEDFINNNTIAFNDIVHPDYQEPLWEKWQKILKEKGNFEEEYPIINSDNEIRWVWERGSGVYDNNGNLLYLEGFILDITDKVNAEEEKKQFINETIKRKEELEFLFEGAKTVLESANFEITSRKLFNLAMKMTGAISGYVALLSDDGIENDLVFLESGDLQCEVDPSLPMPVRGLRGIVYSSGEVLYENDFMNSKWVKYMPEGHCYLKNVLFAPLNIKGKTVGLIGLANKPEDFDENDARICNVIGNLAAIALQNWQAFDALAVSQELYRSFINTQNDLIFVKDDEYRYIIINDALSKFFEQPQENIIYKTDFELMDIEYAEQCKKTDLEALELNTSYTSEEIIENQVYETTKFPIKLRDNKIGIGGIIRNITEKKKIEEEIISAKQKAIESDQLKSAFLANMSHEIRTPLNGIMGFASILDDNDLTKDERVNYINIIKESGNRLMNLVNDLISISKIETGQMNVKLHDFSINQLISNLYNFFETSVIKQGLQLKYSIEFSEELSFIFGDEQKIYQVYSNLINNAIKYTEKGTIAFGYRKLENEILCFVQDTGVGISKHAQELIFERFRQGEEMTNRRFEGAGLGLTISKGLVELMKGKIWVESKVNIGSTFYFTIPYIKSLAPTKTKEATLPIFDKKDKTILIAEDEDTNFLFVERIISKNIKAKTIRAQNGRETIEIFRNNPDISLILLDLKMPLISGYEAYEVIRKENPNIPIIAVTAYAMNEDKDRVMSMGFNNYISKPFEIKTLIDLISYYL